MKKLHLAWHIIRRFRSLFIVAVVALFLLIPQAHAYYNNMPAVVVIGQVDFTHGSGNQGGSVTGRGLSLPDEVFTDGTKLFIPDLNNKRILIFNKIPTANNASADVVIGQVDFTHNAANQGGAVGPNTLAQTASSFTDGKRLFISDYGNNRVLVFNSIPTANNASADIVIGQPDFTTVSSAVSRNGGFVNPDGIFLDPQTGKLLICDRGNNRVLIYNQVPTTNGAPADVVLGQPDFTSFAPNNGGVSASSLFTPTRVSLVDGKLIVGDTVNNRILIYNSVPTTNNASADVVIGQTDFTHNSANQGFSSPRANTLYQGAMKINGKRLYIPDGANNRVLIFNSIPTSNNASADIVLGQPNFTSSSVNQGASFPNSNTFSTPDGATILNNQLIVSDFFNNRVLIFSNQLPDVSLTRTITGQPNGKLRFSGTASTNVTNEIVKQIEYSVNGSTWTGGFPTDGTFDSASEQYYFDFDPGANTMADQQGYTVKIRSTHNNDIDTSKVTLYFEPFLTISPENNSFSLNRLPTFSFSIQKQRFSDLKENLDHFRVMVRPDGQDWRPYINNIPVDYNSVRLSGDNLRPNPVTTMNGTYEDKSKTVTYAQENSVITVQPKAVDSQGNLSDKYWENGGKLLSNATYQWKIQAEDHAGQIQETDPRTLRIGTRQVVTSRPYFPLSIYAISGIPGYFDISTSHPDNAPKTLTLTTDYPKFAPTFAGIATAGSVVAFTIRDTNCSDPPMNRMPDQVRHDSSGCDVAYETTVKADSTYRKTIPKAFRIGNSYDITVSVRDTGDNYNELPEFMVTIAASTPAP